MSEVVAKESEDVQSSQDYKNPAIGWMIGFLFVVSFLGLFSVLPLRKVRPPNSQSIITPITWGELE